MTSVVQVGVHYQQSGHSIREHHLVDRAAILSDVFARNALRRDAKLPLLDVHAVYRREVEQALWREHVERHHEEVRHRVLRDYRERLGSEMKSTGGRWAVNAMVNKALANSFQARRSP